MAPPTWIACRHNDFSHLSRGMKTRETATAKIMLAAAALPSRDRAERGSGSMCFEAAMTSSRLDMESTVLTGKRPDFACSLGNSDFGQNALPLELQSPKNQRICPPVSMTVCGVIQQQVSHLRETR